MISRSGLIWDQKIVFTRYIEDCGVVCEHITPHMLAAPFFRGRFVALIIPTGFGNPQFSCLLPALRATSSRIKRFVESGGNLLVFGAATDNPSAYDWLPFHVTYRHAYGAYRIELDPSHPCSNLLSDYDPECVECDGCFPEQDGLVIARADGCPVMIEKEIGKGKIVVSTIHEYPSRCFVKEFCSARGETLF
ncbi:MAG TPA: hypothetical protein VMW63_07100 [Methanoregulaceae archaeon]|nr:hypothetical protein [Methanoregulaceae archaeon]